MPEGDTIFRTATVLRRALVGGVVRKARAQPGPGLPRVPDLSALVGSSVASVEARGKHLLIGFSGGRWLRTHMRMKGSWHRYRPGEPWRLPSRRAVCVLETDAAVAVCFDAPVVELLTDAELARHAALRSLGPDLLAPEPDMEEALVRLRVRAAVPLGEALLDQRVAAGIGNAIKSEALFMERLDPWAPVRAFSDQELRGVLHRAAELLAANVGGGRRVTTGSRRPGESLWVYRRTGRPCRRCGTLIRARRQGTQARTTYWCPSCQGTE
jgi:endonuclease-8